MGHVYTVPLHQFIVQSVLFLILLTALPGGQQPVALPLTLKGDRCLELF